MYAEHLDFMQACVTKRSENFSTQTNNLITCRTSFLQTHLVWSSCIKHIKLLCLLRLYASKRWRVCDMQLSHGGLSHGGHLLRSTHSTAKTTLHTEIRQTLHSHVIIVPGQHRPVDKPQCFISRSTDTTITSWCYPVRDCNCIILFSASVCMDTTRRHVSQFDSSSSRTTQPGCNQRDVKHPIPRDKM